MSWKHGNGDSYPASTFKKMYLLSCNIFTTTEAEAIDELQLQLVTDPTSSLCQLQANTGQLQVKEGFARQKHSSPQHGLLRNTITALRLEFVLGS